jgi:hypothetical protein
MAPSRYALEPDHGYVGDPILIKDLLSSPEIDKILFGEAEAEVIRADPTGVLCAAPPHDPGTVTVSVISLSGERVDVGRFTYDD